MARHIFILASILASLLLLLSAGRTQQVAAAAAAVGALAPGALVDTRGGGGGAEHLHDKDSGGGWLSWLGFGSRRSVEELATPPPVKREAAKEHAKASWWWGKSYAKDKAAEAEEQAERGARRARDETAEGLKVARRKVGEQFDSVRSHAKKVAHSAEDEVKHGVDATKGAARRVGDKVVAGKRKIDQVGDAVVVLSDAKHAYDKYNTGKARTKRFFRRLWEFVWPPARSPTAAQTRHCAVVDETDVLVPGSVIPRSVGEALENYEACKEEMEDVAMREQEEEVEPSKRRGWFQSAKDKLKGKPILKTEKGPQKSFRERWEEEMADDAARAKGRH